MLSTLKFILAAYKAGRAYIDVDGTILMKFPVPLYREDPSLSPLEWWKENLAPTRVIKRRLPLLYLLKVLGVKLILWTNRSRRHELITMHALRKHDHLFSHFFFFDGQKNSRFCFGPVMDDDAKYANRPGDLLVKSI